jgi:spore coat protein E
MLKEIVTKAVVSKGKIVDSNDIELEIKENANKAIGCWIINHNYLCVVENNKVNASGYYDIHIWYAIDDSKDTSILKKTIEYRQEFVLDNTNFDYDTSEYKIYCIEYPNCSNLQLVNNKFLVTIKKGLAIDVIGESKLLVQVSEGNIKSDDMSINTNYMNR